MQFLPLPFLQKGQVLPNISLQSLMNSFDLLKFVTCLILSLNSLDDFWLINKIGWVGRRRMNEVSIATPHDGHLHQYG